MTPLLTQPCSCWPATLVSNPFFCSIWSVITHHVSHIQHWHVWLYFITSSSLSCSHPTLLLLLHLVLTPPCSSSPCPVLTLPSSSSLCPVLILPSSSASSCRVLTLPSSSSSSFSSCSLWSPRLLVWSSEKKGSSDQENCNGLASQLTLSGYCTYDPVSVLAWCI